MLPAHRSIEFAILTLVGIPGNVWCGMTHICMAGHLDHAEMPEWWFYADLGWAACLLAAAATVLRSAIPNRGWVCAMLVTLVVSRLLLVSGGGILYVGELPVLVYLGYLAVATLMSAWWAWRQRP